MINPWLIIGVIVVWIASLVGVGYWQNAAGHTAERALWQERENTELTTANNEIIRLTKQAVEDKKANNEAVAEITTHYERIMQNAQDLHAADVAAVRAGTLKLRDRAAACEGSGAGITSPAVPSSSGRDGSAGCELSGAATEFLLGEASRADQNTEQLAASQLILLEDRRLCGE